MSRDGVRQLLVKALAWQDAHVGFDKAVAGVPPDKRGLVPPGLPHSLWQMVEHLRIAQEDILDFCRNPDYAEKTWPDDYWPASPEPPSPSAWRDSIARYLADRQALQEMAADPSLDLDATIPHGSGQTYAREIVLVVDHAAYHVGQLVLARRLLGIWE